MSTIIQRPLISPNQYGEHIHGPKREAKPTLIVVHSNGVSNQSAEIVRNHFQQYNPVNPNYANIGPSSAHYVIDTDENKNVILQLAQDDVVAWHCGRHRNKNGQYFPYHKHYLQLFDEFVPNSNDISIGIEVCEGPMPKKPDAWKGKAGLITAKSVDVLLDLVKRLQRTYGISNDKVVRHYDVTGKACPLYWDKLVDPFFVSFKSLL